MQTLRSETYKRIQQKLCQGWNTWNTNSLLSHVLLPEGLAVNLCLKGAQYLKNTFPSINRPSLLPQWYTSDQRIYVPFDPINRPEQIKLGYHADDGSYSSLELSWCGNELVIQSAVVDDDLILLVTVLKSSVKTTNLIVETGMLWNRNGHIMRDQDVITAIIGEKTITVQTCSATTEDYLSPSNTPYLAIPLKGEIGIFTGSQRSLEEVKHLVALKKMEHEAEIEKYGENSEVFQAMQGILAWNLIYDPENDRAITPVSRLWAALDGGFVLFDWDTYFASYMYSMYNKELAYANAIEITKSITPGGFIPNVARPYGFKSFDHSQPPVGSFVVKEIYKNHRETWFLEEIYEDLITWDRWWVNVRNNKDYLCWGSDKTDSINTEQAKWQAAAYESGLDNSPMYDGVPFNMETSLLEIADVGLMSMYILDCESLAEIARVLNKKEDEAEPRTNLVANLLFRLLAEATPLSTIRNTGVVVFGVQ